MTTAPIVIAGGSGFIGRALQQHFAAMDQPTVVLTRRPNVTTGPGEHLAWDGRTLGSWADRLDGAAGLVNLTGRSVDCRYHAANRAEILASRIDSVRVLAQAVQHAGRPPSAWIQAGTTAIYGEAGGAILDESAKPNDGFSPQVAKQWEAAFQAADVPDTRKVLLRISFVLGPGGALSKLGRLTRWFLGGTVGSGKQWVSWIHQHDLARIIDCAVQHDDMVGLYHATGPEPVTNRRFMAELRRALHRPWAPPTPSPLVRLGSMLLRTEPELALKGRRCIPRRLLDAGFTFDHPHLPDALNNVFTQIQDGPTTLVAQRGE